MKAVALHKGDRIRLPSYNEKAVTAVVWSIIVVPIQMKYIFDFSSAINTYLLAHTLKHLNQIRVLSLPKQCDDDVASIIGINCPR